MTEEARRNREESSNVDPSLMNLSRKCSNCGQTGHNSRTCLEARDPTASEAEHKSHTADSNITSAPHLPVEQLADGAVRDEEGQASDCSVVVKKKGIPWTEEEHKLFLKGLQKLGKGDWRGISRQFVQTRSPTQVASHAQKYFIRQSVVGKRKRRSSLFDLVPDGSQELKEEVISHGSARRGDATEASAQPSSDALLGKPAFPPVPQGAEAFALACWYQGMLMQQGYMQAMFGQMSPSLYGPGMPNGNPDAKDQQASTNLAAQQQAAAFLSQQQISAAVAMGGFPFGLSLPQGSQEWLPGKPYAKEQSGSGAQQQTSAQPLMQPNDILQFKAKAKQHDEGQAPTAEVFGNGRLVKPKAFRAQSFGSIPSYMLGSQSDSQAQMTSCSRDSQDSFTRLCAATTTADPSSYTGGVGSTLAFHTSAPLELSCGSEDSRTLRQLAPE